MTTKEEMERAVKEFKSERRAARMEIRRVLSNEGYVTRDGEHAEQVARKMTREQ
jgi:hypothetical protein